MTRATSLPIRPKPKTPMVLPSSVLPAMAGQASSRMRAFTWGILRNRARISATVNSVVDTPLSAAVPVTAMPRRVAFARSKCLLVRPVCEMSFRLGSWEYSLSLKKVRSRIRSTASNSRSAATIFSEPSSLFLRSVTSARAWSSLYAGTVSASFSKSSKIATLNFSVAMILTPWP